MPMLQQYGIGTYSSICSYLYGVCTIYIYSYLYGICDLYVIY
jgi:hypothetical protein